MSDAKTSTSLAETIFVAARQLSDSNKRVSYLEKACGEDRGLREQVERMLKAEEKANQFFGSDPLDLKAASPALRDVTHGEGAQAGSYKLLQQIGEGGCGIVYMAEQEQPIRRRVALKLIKPGMDTRQVIARFEAERQALAMMDHPNIARVLDAGANSEGRPFFVMELVRGIPITEYCDQNNLGARERLELFAKVVQAVQHAHQKGIIHRDLKPSNVLVTLHDGVPVPKVIDFGIAKAIEQKLTDKTLFTQFEQFIGTPAYTSPEQAEMSGLDVDTRSDIYSLGVLLYELLVGITPFDSKDLLRSGLSEMRRMIREDEPDRPSARLSTMEAHVRTATAQRRAASAPALIHQLKGDLDWIVMKCLEKDRTRRYDAAGALGADIQNYLANAPVLARPPSAAYRFGKLLRRNKLSFAAGAAVALALILGMIVSLWQANRARRAEIAAKTEKESAEAVLKFFQDTVLAAGRPEGMAGGLGKDVTLRKAIDAAETQIAKTLQDQPLVEAAIRFTIGKTYKLLGEDSLALQQMERALKLRQDTLGPKHTDTLAIMSELVVAYIDYGKNDAALKTAEEVFALEKSTSGADHPDTIDSMTDLGWCYFRAGRLDLALSTLETAYDLQKKKAPEGIKAALMFHLAEVYDHSSRREDAVTLFERALELCKAQDTNSHNTLVGLNGLAWTYYRLGRKEQALPLFEEGVERSKARLGPAHWRTISSVEGLVFCWLDQGKLQNAEDLVNEMLSEARGSPRPTAAYLALRGYIHLKRSERAEAIKVFTEAIQTDGRALFYTDRGHVLADEKRWTEAIDDYSEAIRREPTVARHYGLRAEARARSRRWSEAATDFAAAIGKAPHDHQLYHHQTACLVQAGGSEAYRKHCAEIVSRFSEATDPQVAERMAKDCSILPGSGVDLKVLVRWKENALAAGGASEHFQWILVMKGLVQLREGKYSGAAETMQKIVENDSDTQRRVDAWMVIAMARYHLQEPDAARSALAKGLALAEASLTKPEDFDNDFNWVDWVFAHALMREARALIQGRAD